MKIPPRYALPPRRAVPLTKGSRVSPGTILIRNAIGCTAQITPTLEFCDNGMINGFEQCNPPDIGGEAYVAL